MQVCHRRLRGQWVHVWVYMCVCMYVCVCGGCLPTLATGGEAGPGERGLCVGHRNCHLLAVFLTGGSPGHCAVGAARDPPVKSHRMPCLGRCGPAPWASPLLWAWGLHTCGLCWTLPVPSAAVSRPSKGNVTVTPSEGPSEHLPHPPPRLLRLLLISPVRLTCVPGCVITGLSAPCGTRSRTQLPAWRSARAEGPVGSDTHAAVVGMRHR